jgi:hypothetical protein
VGEAAGLGEAARRGEARMSPTIAVTPSSSSGRLGETGLLSQGVQARRKALRIRNTNGMEVRIKKRPRGVKKRPRGFK